MIYFNSQHIADLYKYVCFQAQADLRPPSKKETPSTPSSTKSDKILPISRPNSVGPANGPIPSATSPSGGMARPHICKYDVIIDHTHLFYPF